MSVRRSSIRKEGMFMVGFGAVRRRLYGKKCLLTGEFNAEDVFDVFKFMLCERAY